jgi:hypothetical protein
VAVGDAPAPGTPVAADGFTRTLTGGWGTAPLGGTWKLQGTPADFAVTGAAGTERLGAGTTREAYLDTDLVRDIEATARVSTDKAAAGGNQFAYLAVRRDATGAYRAKLRFATDGRVYLQLLRGTGNAETALGAEQQLAGLTHGPGVWFRIRLQAVGANPTTLRARVWADGSAEPAEWTAGATDGAAERQIPGGIALRAYVGGPTTNAPVLASWDDLEAHVAAP